MSTEDVSRMFMPQRKVVTRSSSSSSLSSNTSNSSSTTVTSNGDSTHVANGDGPAPFKKKQRGGFWPVQKAEPTSSVTNARANGAVQPASNGNVNILGQKNNMQTAVPDHAANGVRSAPQNTALLILLPMNGTFERKQINVPMHPDPPQKIGRQTNNKTTPKQDNGYFDSKVLSRQHAEIWADTSGRVWIRDVKSSNGTFVNGTRLSPENRESEPTELRQHDSLELGIDIVSEDQKTVVHHKVSAKVEFAGFPGKTGNALDLLSFGELDPSQGHSLLNPSMGTPMTHSRSQSGRSLNGRTPSAINVNAGGVNNTAQRQVSYWGTPLNIEQLVKQVGVEMRAAKQQAQDLEQARTYLTAILPADGSPAKLPQINGKDGSQPPKVANGRVKSSRLEHPARIPDLPGSPPQQPLPERPDSIKVTTPSSAPFTGILKRETTAKQLVNGVVSSPTAPQQSQILSLIESLNEAKRQIESQGSKVKELEDMLKQERQAREAAEDKVKRLEETTASKATSAEEEPVAVEEMPKTEHISSPPPQESHTESALQQRIDMMLSEMQIMQQNIEQTTKRAEDAEAEKSSLAEMIEKYRKQNSGDGIVGAKEKSEDERTSMSRDVTVGEQQDVVEKDVRHTNGYVRGPKLPEQLQQAVTMALQHQQQNGEIPAQYAPYVSMVGVVLIGVGLMAYLNSWQKVDK